MSETFPKVGVGVMLLNERGQALVGRRTRVDAHGRDTYAWPGGHVDFGEDILDTARREVREEAGVEIDDLQVLCINNIRFYGRHYLDIQVIGRIISGEPKVMQPEEMDSWAWYDLDSIPEPHFEPMRLAIEAYRTGRFCCNFGAPLYNLDDEEQVGLP